MSGDQRHPYASKRRVFHAVAMPQGDLQFGVAGPLVQVMQYQDADDDVPGYAINRLMIFTRAEAQQLRDQLGAALRAFDLLAEQAGVPDHPRPYHGPYPIRDHGTLADHGFVEGSSLAETPPLSERNT